MPDGLKRLGEKIAGFWKPLEKGQKTRIIASAAILVLAIIITLVLSLRVEYVPLFDTTEEVSLQPVVSYLDENNIKYKKGTNQVFVDSRKKSDIEFDLTTQAIVSPNVTFSETWSQLSLTSTEADKAQLWKDYLTKDLVYKLKKFENVENAEVQYSKPEQTYWTKATEEAVQGSAFVMLKTKSTLANSQIKAAMNVVAASLGVPAENITLVDQNLNPLSDLVNQPAVEKAVSQDEIRKQRTLEMERKVYDLFKVGQVANANFDYISPAANLFLDFDTQKSVSTTYTAPDERGEGFVKNSESASESLVNGDAGDIPGTDTNPELAPSYQVTEDGNATYNSDSLKQERIFNQTDSETEKAVGNVISDKSTFSIVLWYGKNVASDEGLTTDFLNGVRQSVSTATGIPSSNITVSIQKIMAEEPEQTTLTDTLAQFFEQFGFYVIMLILLLVMVLAAMPRRKSPQPRRAGETAVETAAAEAAAARAMAINLPSEPPLPEINIQEQSELKKQIEKFVQQNPDAVAQLLRNWLADDWE